jgi:hypothetical protein
MDCECAEIMQPPPLRNIYSHVACERKNSTGHPSLSWFDPSFRQHPCRFWEYDASHYATPNHSVELHSLYLCNLTCQGF